MKPKFRYLEQMRAERQRREDEITLPYRAELEAAGFLIASLRRRLCAIEEAFGKGIAAELEGRLAHEISRRLLQQVYQAAENRLGPFEPVVVKLDPNVVRFADPHSLEAEVVRRYRRETLPRLSIKIDEAPTECVTMIDVRVPEMGYRHALRAYS